MSTSVVFLVDTYMACLASKNGFNTVGFNCDFHHSPTERRRLRRIERN